MDELKEEVELELQLMNEMNVIGENMNLPIKYKVNNLGKNK